MSTIKVNSIKNTSTNDGGIAIDNSGHVEVDGQQLPTAGALSNRNLIINGAHIVWQRQTSVSGGSALDGFQYATDRFWLYAPSSTSGTVGQSTDVPSGFIYSTHNNLDSSCSIGTNVELLKQGSDAPFIKGDSYTFSFYIKSTSARTGVSLTITTRDTAGGSGSVTRASGVSFNSTTSWTRVEKTFTIINNVSSNNRCLQIEFSLAVGDKVTGFQLEKGGKATPFEHRSYGDELAKCQRYYETTYRSGYSEGHNFNQQYPFTDSRPAAINFIASDDTTSAVSFGYRVTKRTDPTVRLFSANTGASNKAHTYRNGSGNNSDVTVSAVMTTPNYCTIATSLNAVNRANEAYLHIVAESEL